MLRRAVDFSLTTFRALVKVTVAKGPCALLNEISLVLRSRESFHEDKSCGDDRQEETSGGETPTTNEADRVPH
jgi:hypothetical protein